MDRRDFLNTAAASGMLAWLSGCGGSGAIVSDEIEYRYGLDMLPESPAIDPALLSAPTPGQSFSVSVMIGDTPQAGVQVQVYDIHDILVDSGTTDAAGAFVSTAEGRNFLVAVADTAQGRLYGFEYNFGTKIQPVIDVNLLPTVLARLYDRTRLSPAGIDFVMKKFFGVDAWILLSDLGPTGSALDQARLAQRAQASGLGLQGYLDALVDGMAQGIADGFATNYETLAGSGSRRSVQSAAKAPDECGGTPRYDDLIDENIPDELKDLVNRYWTQAAKWALGFAVKKGASAIGVPIIGTVGDLILAMLFPSSDPVKEALAEIKAQLRDLSANIQQLLQRLDKAEFNRSFDEVRSVFNAFDAIAVSINRTSDNYERGAISLEDYSADMLRHCNDLVARDAQLVEAYNRFVGLRSFLGAGVLTRWMEYMGKGHYYSALVQKQYTDLLDYFQQWNTLCYAYLINAHESIEKLTGKKVNAATVLRLNQLLEATATNLEKLRPRYLGSRRQFIDLRYGLTWVGRCTATDQVDAMMPAAQSQAFRLPGHLDLPREMRNTYVDPCSPDDMPPGWSAAIGEDLIAQFSWRLPSAAELNSSFATVIRDRYGKAFNFQTFADEFNLSDSTGFCRVTKPAVPIDAVVLRDPIEGAGRRPIDGGRGFRLSLYDLGKLASYKRTAYAQPDGGQLLGGEYYFFPVADIPQETLARYLPWSVYQAADDLNL
ncbi:hypothetical protein EGT29_25505 [Pigmentiphaga sp. H8]|uniref:hypothetical protein n=1 Tax=Pigmentiphaga sp. H8 TaxID=2488560 RepID=UPI000F59A62C|nr:hypothetical protein [Pigmentiphaga sp. H8]AZG10972.1 hypothetical protein EGT29_25505 [Pigmentiphaga sp. H8]